MPLTPDQLAADLELAKKYESALATGASMLPVLIGQAQSLLPQKGKGQQKLAMVQSWVQDTLAALGHDIPIVESVWAKLEPVIATLVTLYTKTPVFATLLGMTVAKQP